MLHPKGVIVFGPVPVQSFHEDPAFRFFQNGSHIINTVDRLFVYTGEHKTFTDANILEFAFLHRDYTEAVADSKGSFFAVGQWFETGSQDLQNII